MTDASYKSVWYLSTPSILGSASAHWPLVGSPTGHNRTPYTVTPNIVYYPPLGSGVLRWFGGALPSPRPRARMDGSRGTGRLTVVLARFLPRDEQFFGHFDDAAANAAEVARVLVEVVAQGQDVERHVRRLRDLEHRGDEITHNVFNALNSTFVTPLDREDIRDLTAQLDDFVDGLEEAGRRLWLYRPQRADPEPARLLVRILSEQAELLAHAVPLLERAGKEGAVLLRHAVEVHRLENEADEVLNEALASLYDGVTEVPALVQAMRWGELYGLLEDATDRAEDVANTLEGLVHKHA